MADGEQVTVQPYRVMICVDNSENAFNGFLHYADHIYREDHEVYILHVSDQVKMPTYALFSEGVGFSPEEMKARVEELRKKNKALKEKFDGFCEEKNLKHKTLVVSEDPDGPGAAICAEAKKHDINLIVMGSRGLGKIRRTFLGSISSYVVHHSHTPTLVVPVHKHSH